jgi:outer membrane biosynthesis protein TonB
VSPPPTAPAQPAAATTTTTQRKKQPKPPRSTTTTTAPPPTTTTKPAPAPSKSAPAPDGGTSTDQSGSTTQTLSSTGGAVAVKYENNRVRLVWARPNAGYSVRVENDGPWVVEVRFRSSSHRSRIWAFYKDGAPSHHVREENLDGNESSMDTQSYTYQQWWWRNSG